MTMLYCKFCGEKLNEDGQCPNNHDFKKMCINCAFIGETESDEKTGKKALVCMNEDNKKAALAKMMDLINEAGGGYSVKTLEIEPVPLKKPNLKCMRWALSDETKTAVLNLFK
jgi:hypothetical protein